jgi:hypothetical protein
MSRISSHGQPTTGGPLAWRLGEGLTTPHRNKHTFHEMLHTVLDLDRFFKQQKQQSGLKCWNMES